MGMSAKYFFRYIFVERPPAPHGTVGPRKYYGSQNKNKKSEIMQKDAKSSERKNLQSQETVCKRMKRQISQQ